MGKKTALCVLTLYLPAGAMDAILSFPVLVLSTVLLFGNQKISE
jgi:hypothetical protein